MRKTFTAYLACFFLGTVAIGPTPGVAAEEDGASIFLKPVPPELSDRIETAIGKIEEKFPLDLASRRSLVLAFAVRMNPKNERVYFNPDPQDVKFLAEDIENFQVREMSHTFLALMQFRAIGAGALPYLARKMEAQDDERRHVAFFTTSASFIPPSRCPGDRVCSRRRSSPSHALRCALP